MQRLKKLKYIVGLTVIATGTLIVGLSSVAQAAPSSWTQLRATDNYMTAALSSDGQYGLAGTESRLYLISNNNTITETRPAGNNDRLWNSLAISKNGNRMLAGTNRLYISRDGAATWEETQPAGNVATDWDTVSVSAMGNIMLAGTGTELYVSSDGGANWDEVLPAGNTGGASYTWRTSAISGDGKTMLAGMSSGRLYLSHDSGDTWQETQPDGNVDFDWRSADISTDGEHMIAVARGGDVYMSANGGDTWNKPPVTVGARQWMRAQISDTGSRAFVSYDTGRLYYTENGGASWFETQPTGNFNRYWYAVAMNGDGTKYIAGSYAHNLYVAGTIGDTPGSLATADSDGDGFTDSEEQSAPNGGDANNDGVLDDIQPHVAGIENALTGGAYIALELSNGCTITNMSTRAESANAQQDANYSYPAGMFDFTADCGTNGFTTTVSQYYYGTNDTNYVLRKYNPNTSLYATVSGVTKQSFVASSGGVLKVSYSVTDGGSLDADGTANGIIVDPVGLASAVSSSGNSSGGSSSNSSAGQSQSGGQLANTGLNLVVVNVIAVSLMVSAAVLVRLRSSNQT